MKILHIGKFCPPNEGGMELFSYDLLEALNKKCIKADLLCFDKKTKKYTYRGFGIYACKINIKINSVPVSYDFVKIFNKIAYDYDALHIHSPNPLGEILSLLINKPKIIHWQSDIVRQKISYEIYKPIQHEILKRATKIIVTSPQYVRYSEQLKMHIDKTIIIPLGINPRRLVIKDESIKEFENIKNKIKKNKIVLAVGRLVEYKGFKYLVEASKYLNHDIIVIIIGRGPLFKCLQNKINNLNLSDKVLLLGRVHDVSIYMNKCDVFCLPSISRNEAFGLVLLEALHFGKPLVTTDVKGSGMNYVNKHNVTGLVVPPKDPRALAEAINKILSDKSLYREFSKNAFERVKEFEIGSIADRVINLYKEVLG